MRFGVMMSKEIIITRQGSVLVPVTEADRAVMLSLKIGDNYKAEIKAQSQRSVQHHRLFFALLQVTLDYWNDSAGVLSPSEVATLKGFASWLDKQGGDTGAIKQAARDYLLQLRQSRSERLETPQKSIDALLTWVKYQVGHVDLIATPAGIMKQPKSISFHAMTQEQFADFYQRAFNVCWRFVMSRHFESEQEAQRVIDQISSMG